MRGIWYVLRCPEGNEADYIKEYQKSVTKNGLQEILYFQYQRMIRYGGHWHLERRTALPGYIFISGNEKMAGKQQKGENKKDEEEEISLSPCEIPYLKTLCPEGNLIEISKGMIKDGVPIVTNGPLQGREQLIKNIDRHKRTAEIVIPLEGWEKRITVGLEIYDKQ